MDTTTTAPEAAPVTDNAAEVATPVSTETAKPAEAKTPDSPKETKAAPSSDEKAYRLKELIELTEKNPNKVLSKEDQAIYDEHVLNGLEPKDRPEAKEKPVEKAEKPVEKVEKTEKPEIPEHIQAAMKEVGAKTPEEIPAKIKELRQAVSGKETAAVSQLKQEFARKAENEAALWRDFMDGKPEALAHVEKAYGVKPKAQTQQAQPVADFDPEVLADADAITGGLASKLVQQNKRLMEELEGFKGQFQSHQKTIQEQGIRQTASAQLVDEMLAVAVEFPDLKDAPGLRNAIIDRVVHGKEDPRLDAFNELFQIAQEAGTDLRNALLIKRGRDAALLIEKAREEGLQQAYNHKPNRSLSSIQTEDAQPQSFTDSQYAEMSKDFRKIPDTFFDKNGNLDKAKIPKKGWSYFGLDE